MAERAQRNDANEVEEVRQLLRNRNIRATPARISVLQQLRNAKSPLTHADLADKLVPLGIDKATVFRNLTDLTDADLISRRELGDPVWRFEILDPNKPRRPAPPFCVCRMW
ncbi:hypothetical protein KOR42_22520 [Thalassoglobus neptunius]|uniref:Ferric uptake regulator family protein n=1 Tax=Thalassoglobus neptunius TaxID=1938619 RepID=A0A5C5X9M4_9PLAN|nr:helix-turn-helix domain-containing protein [Thalassoglobus neptunius]TWT58865.1 hypothetical protein KOR42_22520 [Thalassoglobus neptunius]